MNLAETVDSKIAEMNAQGGVPTYIYLNPANLLQPEPAGMKVRYKSIIAPGEVLVTEVKLVTELPHAVTGTFV